MSSADNLDTIMVFVAQRPSLLLPNRPDPLYPQEVYFDDTGANEKQHDVFMWCGYLADMRYWIDFSKRWRAVLDEPPAVKFWSQRKARSIPREHPFDGLTDRQINDKEEKLAHLLANWEQSEKHKRVAVVARLPYCYLDTYVRGKVTRGAGLTKNQKKQFYIDSIAREQTIAYWFATGLAIKCAFMLDAPKVPLHFYYDERAGDPYQDHARAAHLQAKATHPQGQWVGELRFASARDREPLQAADMLAWHLGQRARRKKRDDEMWPYIQSKPINEFKIGVNELTTYVKMWNELPEPPV